LGFRTFEQHQIPTAWDYVFSRISPCWAVITLKDGGKLYGFVGSESYFSSDPDARDLYISHVIQRDSGGIMKLVPKTAGVYVSKESISLIELLEASDDGRD
jgi:hypothetical protein